MTRPALIDETRFLASQLTSLFQTAISLGLAAVALGLAAELPGGLQLSIVAAGFVLLLVGVRSGANLLEFEPANDSKLRAQVASRRRSFQLGLLATLLSVAIPALVSTVVVAFAG